MSIKQWKREMGNTIAILLYLKVHHKYLSITDHPRTCSFYSPESFNFELYEIPAL